MDHTEFCKQYLIVQSQRKEIIDEPLAEDDKDVHTTTTRKYRDSSDGRYSRATGELA